MHEAKDTASDKFINHGKVPYDYGKGMAIMYNVVGLSDENLEARLVPLNCHITTFKKTQSNRTIKIKFSISVLNLIQKAMLI